MKQLLIVALVVLIFACNDKPDKADRRDGFTPVLKTKEDSLYHDVMQGHDVGMAKIGVLRKHMSKTQHELDSLKKLPAAKVNADYRKALLKLNEDLAYADQAMFTWMKEFEVDSARSDKTKRLQYLELEKVKVEKVRDNILNALQRADSIFSE